MLKLDNVHAFYGKSHVLHGVHFEVPAGEKDDTLCAD